jgi:hypothetical protein
VAFESLAWRYDDLFSRSRIGAQRGAAWEALAEIFRPGDAVLVLNCRTEEDAVFLALLDVSVVARDSAEGMIHTTLRPGTMFDGALLNFSGLNSVVDLNQTARELTSLVIIGAPVIICLSSRFCFSETLWFLLHGKFRKAFRRFSAIATVKPGDQPVNIGYPSLRQVRRLFLPSFLACTHASGSVSRFRLRIWNLSCADILGCSACCAYSMSVFAIYLSFGRWGITCCFTLNG